MKRKEVKEIVGNVVKYRYCTKAAFIALISKI